MSFIMNKFIGPYLIKPLVKIRSRKCHNIFGIKDLIQQEKTDHFTIKPVTSNDHQMALDIIKQYYLPEHVLVKARKMDLSDDHAVDEYLINIFKQGNSMYAITDDDNIAGICINYACSYDDCKNLVKYASYRQDKNTKDFLNFTAKLQKTPNLWEVFKEPTIFEIKMLAVIPEYRRQGLGVMLADVSRNQAVEQGHKVIRMDCINPYDFKIAERCYLQCIARFPLYKLDKSSPFINRTSDYNICVRVYVDYRPEHDADQDKKMIKEKQAELEKLFE